MKNFLSGFTLMELMFTAGIVALVVAGLLQLFIYCLSLGEMAGNVTFAVSEAQGVLEEMRNHNFEDIVTDYGPAGTPGNTFNLTQVEGMGVIYIDDTTGELNDDLLEVEVVVSFRTKPNRIIGEDRDLDGQLDAGEDNNGNLQLDSPATLVSLIAKR